MNPWDMRPLAEQFREEERHKQDRQDLAIIMAGLAAIGIAFFALARYYGAHP